MASILIDLTTTKQQISANSTALINGGPVTLVYSFIICAFGSLATAASLAEMVSMYEENKDIHNTRR